ncbi:MAG: ABC transporter ATPase [Flavobacteriaceae bacterium]
MLVSIDQLPETSRVWIYQSDRKFSDEEVESIEAALDNFIQAWTAHGKDLKAGFEIRYHRFIVIALDQAHTAASGCSIDASVHFIQSLEQKFNLDLLDKMNVTFKQGEYIAYKSLMDFKKMAKEKAISAKTVVFNNLVTDIREYRDHWEVPAEESWHKRFVK